VVVFELKPKMYHTQGEHAIHYTTGGCTWNEHPYEMQI
jgi:hypothetical protein